MFRRFLSLCSGFFFFFPKDDSGREQKPDIALELLHKCLAFRLGSGLRDHVGLCTDPARSRPVLGLVVFTVGAVDFSLRGSLCHFTLHP